MINLLAYEVIAHETASSDTFYYRRLSWKYILKMVLILKWQREEVYVIMKYVFPLFDKWKEIWLYWLFLGHWGIPYLNLQRHSPLIFISNIRDNLRRYFMKRHSSTGQLCFLHSSDSVLLITYFCSFMSLYWKKEMKTCTFMLFNFFKSRVKLPQGWGGSASWCQESHGIQRIPRAGNPFPALPGEVMGNLTYIVWDQRTKWR